MSEPTSHASATPVASAVRPEAGSGVEPRGRDARLARFAALPLALFFVAHLATSSRALGGRADFDAAVRAIHHLPYLPGIEFVGILLPCSAHVFWRVKSALAEGSGRGAKKRDRAALLKTASAAATLAFVVFHLIEFRIPRAFGKACVDAFYPELAARLSSTWSGAPLIAGFYLVGLAATAHYLMTELFELGRCLGVISKERGTRAKIVLGFAGGFLFLLGANTIIYFATGGALGSR